MDKNLQFIIDDTVDMVVKFRVLLEEASPQCWDLPRFVDEYLMEYGYQNVEVRCEW